MSGAVRGKVSYGEGEILYREFIVFPCDAAGHGLLIHARPLGPAVYRYVHAKNIKKVE